MNNREWLYSLDVADLADWFDAEHVDANDVLTRKGDVRADGVCANDGFMDLDSCTHDVRTFASETDSREKLLADLEKQVRFWHDYDGNFMRIYDSVAYAQVKELLDRQAAITERELCKQCDWPSLAAQPDYESQGRIVALTDKVDELTAERDALADDLHACNRERESLRRTPGVAIDHAHDILQLIDEGMA